MKSALASSNTTVATAAKDSGAATVQRQPPPPHPAAEVMAPQPAPLFPDQLQHPAGEERQPGWYARLVHRLGTVFGFFGSIPLLCCFPNPYRQVHEGQTGLVLKFGKYSHATDPGLVYVNPFSEKLYPVDVKIQIAEVPQQVCITRDNVSLTMNSVIYYRVVNPYRVTFGITSIHQAMVERTQTTLRHVVGARMLQEVIERREEVAQSIREIIEETAMQWGVEVESILIKDIVFSRELQESLSMAAQSKRIGESKVIAARAEVEAAKLMRQAADILASKAAMQIRYLETMQQICRSNNAKVIFMPSPGGDLPDGSIAGVVDRPGSPPVPSSSGQSDPAFQSMLQTTVMDNL